MFNNKRKISAGKGFVHYYIIIKYYENNSTEFTEQMIREINILYNRLEGADDIISHVETKILEIL